ncbi:MAG: four helix bundle protein [Myxococcales bacterium]|nr:four helix bundle protein [Myxococcales bacterium]
MLRIYPLVLEVLRELRSLIAQIERRDSDLTRQLRRCASSIPLNTAEGMYSRGKNRQARYHSALGSAREALACLEVACALGYLPALDPALVAKLNRIIGTFVRLVAT